MHLVRDRLPLNDYRKIASHWYQGQKKMYVDTFQCRVTGEMIRKRVDMGPVFRGDRLIELLAVGELTLQRPCRVRGLPLNKVFDPLGTI